MYLWEVMFTEDQAVCILWEVMFTEDQVMCILWEVILLKTRLGSLWEVM